MSVRRLRVSQAVVSIPRHLFVPTGLRHVADSDVALPIGHGQTIPRRSMVEVFARLSSLSPLSKVLEVGTGSGYLAGVVSKLARYVWTIERIEQLAIEARHRLASLAIHNVDVIAADGWYGLPTAAPFDAIIVSSCASETPPALVEQLAPHGRLVIPKFVGPDEQWLWVVSKSEPREVRERRIMRVAAVPLVKGFAAAGTRTWREADAC